MMKKWLALLLMICLLPVCATAENVVVDLVNQPDTEWAFAEGAQILELYFPPVKGADACILRCGDEVILIDAATIGQSNRVAAALEYMEIDHVDYGFNTHPHDDHIGGFEVLNETAAMDHLYVAFGEEENRSMISAMKAMKAQNIPVTRLGDGDLLPSGFAEMLIIQRDNPKFTLNNRSAMVRLTYGERTILLAADVETAAQNALLETAPELLAVDILKYPHHGVTKAGWNFLKNVNAQLCVITDNRSNTKEARKDADKRGMAQVFTAYGMVRLRTDGQIWVVDQIPLDVE